MFIRELSPDFLYGVMEASRIWIMLKHERITSMEKTKSPVFCKRPGFIHRRMTPYLGKRSDKWLINVNYIAEFTLLSNEIKSSLYIGPSGRTKQGVDVNRFNNFCTHPCPICSWGAGPG